MGCFRPCRGVLKPAARGEAIMEPENGRQQNQSTPKPAPEPRQPTLPKIPVSFPFGQLVITSGALRVIPDHEIRTALARHLRGDWGVVGEADWKENDLSVERGFRILSAYETQARRRFWIITEADRSSTCILLPEEY